MATQSTRKELNNGNSIKNSSITNASDFRVAPSVEALFWHRVRRSKARVLYQSDTRISFRIPFIKWHYESAEFIRPFKNPSLRAFFIGMNTAQI